MRAVSAFALVVTSSIGCVVAEEGGGGAATDSANVEAQINPWPKATRGIYVLSDPNKPIDPSLLADPDITGFALRLGWADLEPARQGRFFWDTLDARIAEAAGHDKQISLSVVAGAPPQWALDAGARTFAFFDRNPNHPDYCEPGTEPDCVQSLMPIPWDETFLAQFKSFIAALGVHCSTKTGIAYVRGATESLTNGWGFPGEDVDGKTWFVRKYGYTSSKELDAMQQVVDAFLAAFPKVPLWAEVGPIPIDPAGELTVADQIAAYGFAKPTTNFAVWREDLYTANTPPPDPDTAWQILYEHPERNGAQMFKSVLGAGDPASALQKCFDNAVGYGMHYVEIYKQDALEPSLQATVAAGDAALKL